MRTAKAGREAREEKAGAQNGRPGRRLEVDGAPVDLGGGKSARILTVLPEAAAEWLKKTHPNARTAGRRRVRSLAADMARENWLLSDQPVTWDEDGWLINGIKRCHACVLADKPFTTLVLYGWPREAVKVADGAQKRSTANLARSMGYDWPQGAGAVVRRVMQGLDAACTRVYTDLEIEAFMEYHGAGVKAACDWLRKGPWQAASVRAAVARAFECRKGRARLEAFCRVVSTGIMEPGEDAAVLLRNEILAVPEKYHSHVGRTKLYALAESALDSFLRGERVKKLLPAEQELFRLSDEGWWNNPSGEPMLKGAK